MWLSKLKTCGCPQQPNIDEEEKIEYITLHNNIKVEFPEREIKMCELKCKVIKELFDILDSLKCGIQPDLELLLEEISLIYINDNE